MINTFQVDQFRKQIEEARLRQKLTAQAKAEGKNRIASENADAVKPTFLRPNDVAGDYDFSRTLKTTIGGLGLRDITLQDLNAISKNIKTMGAMYKGGITIPQVIALSRQEDIDRANRQIHYAMPISRRGGLVEFVTNASGQNKEKFYRVHVEFQAYDSIVLEPTKQKSSTIKNRLANGKVKIECTCGRFTYWYRYMATLGNYVLGRKESAFPKIRNPENRGIACKHILRTMQMIRSPLGQQYLSRAIDKDRSAQHGRRYSATPQAIGRMMDEQVKNQGRASQRIKASTAEVKKLEQRIKSQIKKVEQNQGKLDEKARRIARLEANYKAGLMDKSDFDFYMKVEHARKY